MPNPVTPSRAKALIPSTTGSRCERFSKLFQLTSLFAEDVTYKYNEAGLPTDAFKNDLCAIGCLGGGGNSGPPPNPNMPAPTHVMATDDSFSDKIRVTWNAVTPPDGVDAVTEYNVYRSLATNLDPTLAELVGTVSAPTLTFDDPVDADLVVGTNYIYWVTATNGSDTSSYSVPDYGRAAAPTTDLPAITDLQATQGFSELDGNPIGLVFTTPPGASKFSVYRNTVNDFSTATKVIDQITPQNPAAVVVSAQSPDQAWNNTDSILILHFPPSSTVHYFFWIVAHRTSPPSVSPESNAAEGWVRSYYAPFLGSALRLNRGESATEGVEFSGSDIRVVVVSGAGGGAGGSQIYGAGGGGAGEIVIEEFPISPGDVISLEASPDAANTGNAAATTNGADGSDMIFKINGVAMITAKAGKGGEFSSSGGGAGGDAGTGSTGTTSPTIYAGHAGLPGVGSAGGATGYRFGNRRYPPAWFNGFSGYDGNGPSVGDPGGGAKAAPGVEVLSVGGYGRCGFAIIVSTSL